MISSIDWKISENFLLASFSPLSLPYIDFSSLRRHDKAGRHEKNDAKAKAKKKKSRKIHDNVRWNIFKVYFFYFMPIQTLKGKQTKSDFFLFRVKKFSFSVKLRNSSSLRYINSFYLVALDVLFLTTACRRVWESCRNYSIALPFSWNPEQRLKWDRDVYEDGFQAETSGFTSCDIPTWGESEHCQSPTCCVIREALPSHGCCWAMADGMFVTDIAGKLAMLQLCAL